MLKTILFISFISLLLFSCIKTNKTISTISEKKILSNAQQIFYKLGFQTFEDKIMAPDFNLPDLDDSNFKLSDNKGKVIILNIWVTWSEDSKEEIPLIEKLNANINNDKLIFLGVNSSESKSKVRNFIKENNIGYKILLDKYNIVMSQYSSGELPTTYIIDKNGYVIARFIGSFDWNNELIKTAINELINE